MVDRDLGQATIVYEDPDEGAVEKTVENEHVAYFQDHWIVKTDESEAGHDVIRRIPAQRVHYVERSVEEFEQEVQTLRDQVQSFADDLRSRFLGGGDESDREGRSDVRRVEVETGEESQSSSGSRSRQRGGESERGDDDGESGSGDGGESESDDEEWSGDEDDEVEGGPGRGGEGP